MYTCSLPATNSVVDFRMGSVAAPDQRAHSPRALRAQVAQITFGGKSNLPLVRSENASGYLHTRILSEEFHLRLALRRPREEMIGHEYGEGLAAAGVGGSAAQVD